MRKEVREGGRGSERDRVEGSTEPEAHTRNQSDCTNTPAQRAVNRKRGPLCCLRQLHGVHVYTHWPLKDTRRGQTKPVWPPQTQKLNGRYRHHLN